MPLMSMLCHIVDVPARTGGDRPSATQSFAAIHDSHQIWRLSVIASQRSISTVFAEHHRLRDGPRHFVFDDGRVIGIWFGSSSSGKSQSLIESDGGFVVARDHQQ